MSAGKAKKKPITEYVTTGKNAAITITVGIVFLTLGLCWLLSMLTAAEGYITAKGEKYYVNLKEINALWLRRAGVTEIEISDACTSCQHERFWSHRVTRGQRGSQGAFIACKEA